MDEDPRADSSTGNSDNIVVFTSSKHKNKYQRRDTWQGIKYGKTMKKGLEFPSLTWDTWNMGFMRMNAGSLNFIAVRLMMALIS